MTAKISRFYALEKPIRHYMLHQGHLISHPVSIMNIKDIFIHLTYLKNEEERRRRMELFDKDLCVASLRNLL